MSPENVSRGTSKESWLNSQQEARQDMHQKPRQNPETGAARWVRSPRIGRFNVWNMVRYLLWLIGQVLSGSLLLARRTLTPGTFAQPSIVSFPLRGATDLEVTWMASSITITPGTLVVGTAHGTDTEPVTVFVHSVFDADRDSVRDGLRDMEDRLLRMTRGSGWEDRPEVRVEAEEGRRP